MPMESNIRTQSSSFAAEATNMLREVRTMMHWWMAKKMEAEGMDYPSPEQCPCLEAVFTAGEPEGQMATVTDGVTTIYQSAGDVKTKLESFLAVLRAPKFYDRDASFISSEDPYCLDCSTIAEFKQNVEQAVCKLSAEVAVFQVAVQAVLGSYYLLADCSKVPSGQWTMYRGKMVKDTPSAAPPSDDKPAARGKQSA